MLGFCIYSVDAAKEDGSLGRLVNDDHINPNAKMKYLTLQGKPHLCLFAIRDINQGEEITYNYGDSNWPWRFKVIEIYVNRCVNKKCFVTVHAMTVEK